MACFRTFFSYPDRTIPVTAHTDDSDKQLEAIISKNNKPIDLFSRILSSTHRNYNTTKKELLAIVECLNQFRGIISEYEINVFSDNKNGIRCNPE